MLLEVIRDQEKKNPEDKMRLFLIYYLSTADEVPKEDMDAYEKALGEAGCDLTPLEYIKRYVGNKLQVVFIDKGANARFSVRQLMRMTSMISSPSVGQSSGFSQNDLFRGFSSIGNKVPALTSRKRKRMILICLPPS